MSPEDQYPSTEDCEYGQAENSDYTLACLLNARKRYEEGGIRTGYVTDGGSWVCAIGAMWVGSADAGMTLDDYTLDRIVSTCEKTHAQGSTLAATIESYLRAEAKEAIDLVNAAAVELFPASTDYGRWSGPLEWVNQSWAPDGMNEEDFISECGEEQLEEAVREAVLSIYDRAIAKRRGLEPALNGGSIDSTLSPYED